MVNVLSRMRVLTKPKLEKYKKGLLKTDVEWQIMTIFTEIPSPAAFKGPFLSYVPPDWSLQFWMEHHSVPRSEIRYSPVPLHVPRVDTAS